MPGNYVQIYNPGDINYSAPLNGGVVKVVTVPSATQFTVSASYGGKSMTVGDYSAGYSGLHWQVASMFQTTDQSWLQWLNLFLKGYFTVVANYAQGGTASSVGVTLLPKIQAGPKAEYAFIQYCTNDENSPTPDVDRCLSSIKAIVAGVEALGMVPILCTPPAIGNANATNDPATAAKAEALQGVLQAEQQLAKADSRILLIDTLSRTVTPGDPLGHYLPNYSLDGEHMITYGAVKVAQSVSADLVKLLPLTDLLPASPADDAIESSSGFNIIQNAQMAGTDGYFLSTAYNMITGFMPTGWTFTAIGGTQNMPLAFNLYPNSTHAQSPLTTLDIAVDYRGSGQGFQIGTNAPSGSNFGPRMRPGSWYRCGFELMGFNDLSELNLNGVVWLRLADGTQTSVVFMGSGSYTLENGTPLVRSTPLQYLSQPFLVSQPVSAGYLFVNGHFSGISGTEKFSIGRPMCRTVNNPYQ